MRKYATVEGMNDAQRYANRRYTQVSIIPRELLGLYQQR